MTPYVASLIRRNRYPRFHERKAQPFAPIVVNGELFEDANAAGKALSIHPTTIRQLARGYKVGHTIGLVSAKYV